jgi:riboflavin biosynthesis pyrimidine reductase
MTTAGSAASGASGTPEVSGPSDSDADAPVIARGTGLTEIVPATASRCTGRTADSKKWVSERYRPQAAQWLALNMISSINGSATGPDGTSETLSNRTDRMILGVIRDHADAVLVGAESVRAEGYVIPKTAVLAVVTRSGSLSGHKLGDDYDAERLVVLYPEGNEAQVLANLGDLPCRRLAMPGDDPGPAEIVETLAANGYPSVVCEGGPNLAGQFIRAGEVDAVYLSVAPTFVLPARPLIGGDDEFQRWFTLDGLLVDDDGNTYHRLRPDAQDRTAA